MATAEARRIAVNVSGAQLAVHASGPEGAPCVILTHSILAGADMWLPQVKPLLDLGFRVACLDSRGHGGSTCDNRPLRIATLAGDVVAVMDALQIDKAHFVGLSLGGMVGFDLGQRHAARFLSLAICDARADSPAAFALPWDERIAQAQRDGVGSLVQATVERWFGPGLVRLDPEVLQALRLLMASTTTDGFVATARALQDFDYTAGLGQMTLPVTLIVGDRDGVLPAEMARLTGLIPGAQLETIADAGHLPNLEQPAAFNAVLAAHLARAAAR